MSKGPHAVPEYDARLLLHTDTVTAWDCLCQGARRQKAGEEWAPATRIAFPQHGVYVHSVGRTDVVADVNQMVVINENEPYQVSHPVPGGDATLTVGVARATLLVIIPAQYRHPDGRAALNRSGLRIDARTQLLAAQVRQRLSRQSIGRLEAEAAVLGLVRHALGDTASHTARTGTGRPERMADDVKLLLASDPYRRWTLAEIAREIGVTPVYLTDAFKHAEGLPLYRYHLRMRLALALSLLADCEDLTTLAIDLDFTSHSHFSASFKRTYGLTPSRYQQTLGMRVDQHARAHRDAAPLPDPAELYLSRHVDGTEWPCCAADATARTAS
jgi:AraC family transcriptional regulator